MSMINETGESPAISSPGGNSPYSWILRIHSRVVALIFLPLVSCCLIVAWRFLYSEHQKESVASCDCADIRRQQEVSPKQQRSSMCIIQGLDATPQVKHMSDVGVVLSAQYLFSSAESSLVEFTNRNLGSSPDAAQAASDMNDLMDEMLNRSEIPADYAETMVALFRDKSRGDVVRDFAVQHIGLYVETLRMRGKYNADASESATLRAALWDAAEETRTIVAVAAFRAIADMAVFDPHIDASRLDNQLASCVADSSASPAARVMAAQLCGERHVVTAKPVLARIAADRREPDPLRLAVAYSARLLAE